MTELSERQTKLLKAIVEEFVETGKPVGSKTLVENYNLKISSATVRNEMAALTKKGFLQKPHTSAGRTPTTLGLRFYVSSLMEEKELPVLQEVAVKQRLWEKRFEFGRLLRQAALALAEMSENLSIVSTLDGDLFSAGAVNILDRSEFYDIDVTRAVLHLLDNLELIHGIFSKAASGEEVHILIGEELGLSNLSPCGVVFTNYKSGKTNGFLAVLGPARMEYAKIIPMVRYVGKLLEEVGQAW